MSKVKIYSTTWCAYCRAEKQFLSSKGVRYEDVNVGEDAAAAEEMIRKSGQMGVPVTVITRDDATEAVRIGFDPAWLVSELKLGA